MNYQAFEYLLREIWAPFGRPSPTGDHAAAIYRRCQHVPDEACSWIAQQLGDADTLPRNPGKEISMAHLRWLAAYPGKVAAPPCPHCDTGWLHCWSLVGERWRHWMSGCPVCRAGCDGVQSVQQLEQRGVMVMPVRYHGGPLAFDQDNGLGALWPKATVSGQGLRDGMTPKPVNLDKEKARFRHLPDGEYNNAMGW